MRAAGRRLDPLLGRKVRPTGLREHALTIGDDEVPGSIGPVDLGTRTCQSQSPPA